MLCIEADDERACELSPTISKLSKEETIWHNKILYLDNSIYIPVFEFF